MTTPNFADPAAMIAALVAGGRPTTPEPRTDRPEHGKRYALSKLVGTAENPAPTWADAEVRECSECGAPLPDRHLALNCDKCIGDSGRVELPPLPSPTTPEPDPEVEREQRARAAESDAAARRAAARADRDAERAEVAMEESLGIRPTARTGARTTWTVRETRNRKGRFHLVVGPRLDRPAWIRAVELAKLHGGWSSRRWGSTPAGYGFPTADAAAAFLAEVAR